MSQLLNAWRARPFLSFAALALAVTLIRVAALILTGAELGPDEAQYWVWSREPAFGYYSKPPFIAWTIGATTALFGSAEWAIRLASPFFHFGAALFLYALARRLYDERVTIWTGLAWLTLPGVSLSAMLITTDAPLLFFWSAALYGFFRLADETGAARLRTAALTGAAVGLGFLSKYAMIYFPAGVALALLLSGEMRRRYRPADGLIAIAVALVLLAPNLWWNAAHEFRTLAHTAANTNWGTSYFHPGKLAAFIGAQAGVFGPITFLLFCWGAATLAARLKSAGPERMKDLALFAFAAPPFLIVSAQALISRAHANWAAAAFPAALLLLTAWAFRARLGALAKASVGLHAAAAALLLIAFLNFSLVDSLGLSNTSRSIRGWAPLGAEVEAAAKGYDAVIVDDRDVMGALLYYARGSPPVRAWNSNHRVDHHYEAFMAFERKEAGPVLYVANEDSPRAIAPNYSDIRRIGEVTARIGGGERTLYLFEARGYTN